MTECNGRPADEWLERYLRGSLPDFQKMRFEDHYFDCPVCLSRLQALETLQQALMREPVAIPKTVVPWPQRFDGMAAMGAIAAALVVGLVSFWVVARRPAHPAMAVRTGLAPAAGPQRSHAASAPGASSSSSPLVEMSDLALPAYHAPNLRGEGEDKLFADGMTAYAEGNCGGAETLLARVGPTDKDFLAALFYSGVCRMKNAEFSSASEELRGVADAGDSPEQEAAWYYLAQIALAENDAAGARHYLGLTILLHGDFERRASEELARIAASAGHP